jgi:hypothetical protein
MVGRLMPVDTRHNHRHGYLRGGIPLWIDNPNREQRRLAAKQSGKKKGAASAHSQCNNRSNSK